jgi:cation:H+ antiporter
MSIWILLLMFVVGIVLVVKGGDFFVDAASWIAKAFGIPSFIIGATIVSIATTLPEMIVSIMAAANGQVEMAIGNAVGSVTANTGLILAVAMLFMTIAIKRKDYILQCSLLIAASAILLISSQGGSLSIPGSVVLIVIFFVFMTKNVMHAKAAPKDTENVAIEKKTFGVNIVKFVLGAAGIVLGSQLLIKSGSGIAEFLGVPERIIAVTMVAIGTSLPELVTTITSIVKKESSLSIGNLVGANIIDLTLILPLCSLVSGQALPVDVASATIDMPVCLGVTLIAFVPLLISEKASKLQGVLLLAVYIGYLAVTVL